MRCDRTAQLLLDRIDWAIDEQVARRIASPKSAKERDIRSRTLKDRRAAIAGGDDLRILVFYKSLTQQNDVAAGNAGVHARASHLSLCLAGRTTNFIGGIFLGCGSFSANTELAGNG